MALSLNWKKHLRFPTHPRLSPECTDLLTHLLCEPEDRLGSGPASELSSMRTQTATSLELRTLRGSGPTISLLGSDGVQEIKGHPWFNGIDWESESRVWR